MVAFSLFLERLGSAALIAAIMLQRMRHAWQLAAWPAEPRAALAAHAAAVAELSCETAAAAALQQQQLGMASEFGTVQGKSPTVKLTSDIKACQ